MVYLLDYRTVVLIDNFNDPIMRATEDTIDDVMEALELMFVSPLQGVIGRGHIAGGAMAGSPWYEEPEWVRGRSTLVKDWDFRVGLWIQGRRFWILNRRNHGSRGTVPI